MNRNAEMRKQKFDEGRERRGPSLSEPEREAERAVFKSGGLESVSKSIIQ